MINVEAILMGALSGLLAAALVDFQAFQAWKTFKDATTYDWPTALLTVGPGGAHGRDCGGRAWLGAVSPRVRHPLLLCPLDNRPFRTLTEFLTHCRRNHAERLAQEADALCVQHLTRAHERRVTTDRRLTLVKRA